MPQTTLTEIDAGKPTILHKIQIWNIDLCKVYICPMCPTNPNHLLLVYGGQPHLNREAGIEAAESGAGIDQCRKAVIVKTRVGRTGRTI